MRPRTVLAAACAVLLTVLAACNLPVVNAEADAAARRVYTAVQAGGDLSRDAELSLDLRTPEALAELDADRAMIPKTAPQSVENRGWRFATTSDGGTASLVHAYRYPDCTVVAETLLRKPPGSQTWEVVGFHLHLEDATPDQRRLQPDPALHPVQT